MNRHATAITVLMVLAGAAPLSGQVVAGRLIEAAGGAPVAGASIILLTEAGQTVTGRLTDAEGRFQVEAPGAGRYRVSAERIGFAKVTGEVIELADGETVNIEIRLGTEVIPLDAITVVTEARVPHLERSGFYTRQRSGFGNYIDRNTIDRYNPSQASQLFQAMAGVRVVPRSGRSGGEPVFRNAISMTGGSCLPAIFLDGMPVRSSGSSEPALDDIVQAMDIEAVEVYKGASQIPPQFGGDRSACGVIVIWTRH